MRVGIRSRVNSALLPGLNLKTSIGESTLYRRRFLGLLGFGSAALVLPVGRASAQSGEQNEWRFCAKCHEMFYDGYPDKGLCPLGDGHSAIGYVFTIE